MAMMKDSYRVLVTDANYKHSLAAVRCLAQAGFEVDGVGSSQSLCRWSRFLSRIAYPQSDFCEEKIDEFFKFLSTTPYDVLLPIGAKSVQLVAKHKAATEQYCRVPIASQEKIEICLDKVATASLAEQAGVKVPKVWNFTSLAMLKDHIMELTFPVVVKGRHEIFKDKPAYAYNADQLLRIVASWGQSASLGAIPFPLIQEYIEGTGCGFFALYQQGQCKRIFMHQRIREIPPSGGASCCAVSIYEPDLMILGKKLLDALNWHGVAMVEFKRERTTGQLYLMEINPKFWGSLDLALASGVNFPVLLVHMALGEDIPYSEEYKVGQRFHWPLDGEIQHVLRKPSAMFPVLLDCLNPRVKSNLWLTDPLPALYSLLSEIMHLVVGALRRLGIHKFIYRTRMQGLRAALLRTVLESTGIPVKKYTQITPEIYVGPQHGQVGKRKLKWMGINSIVNMRSEFDDAAHGLALEDYCYLPTAEFDAPSLDQLSQGVAFIDQIINAGGRVYIHCADGVSRAPTMAAAYFISQGLKLEESIELIKKSRPFINILPVQMEQLKRFEAIQKQS